MRLVNVFSLEITSFNGTPPPYAALSHRWSGDETSFELFSNPSGRHGPGFDKVAQCCEFVSTHYNWRAIGGVEWLWVDTCCIDKRSSAELSEAINSMAAWYRDAAYCVAYLSDVPPFTQGRDEVYEEFGHSRWWQRGWTLQELVFPQEVVFCTIAWEIIGFKKRQAKQDSGNDLLPKIAHITNIPEPCLVNVQLIFEQSVARRMSWASRRVTTRTEDTAYALLGLFGINIPLLYGEGSNAFIRLQEEIIKQSSDESIFSWTIKGDFHLRSDYPGLSMLAPHPIHFNSYGDVHRMHVTQRAPYRLSNRILEFASNAIQMKHDSQTVCILELNCCTIPKSTGVRSSVAQRTANTCLIALRQYSNGVFRRIVHGSTGAELVNYLKKAIPDADVTMVDQKLFHIVASRSVGRFASGLEMRSVPNLARLQDHFAAELSPETTMK